MYKRQVLDLTIKKGMNKGWFGNADVAYGTEDRYMARMMVNYIVDKTLLRFLSSFSLLNYKVIRSYISNRLHTVYYFMHIHF